MRDDEQAIANMENCLKLLPHKSYNTCGFVSLILFGLFGIVVVIIASASKTALQCNPEKILASDVLTKKYIETQCSLKYAKQFHHFLPLHVLFVINFGIVLVLSIIYAYLVKYRVESFADPPSSTTVNANNVEDPGQPLMPQAASNPDAFKSSGRYIFTAYTIHLVICRIIPLVVFAALLLYSSNHPNNFDCSWPMQTKGTFANLTQKQTANVSTVDCTNPVGKRNEMVAASVIVVNFFHGSLVFIELGYILWLAKKDDNLYTDIEFASVYILRKRKRIRKLMKKIRERIPDEIFQLHDDFGEKRLSRRKLEEMYVNVIIQNGRQSVFTSQRQHKDRLEIYEAHFKAPSGARILHETADLFIKRATEMGPDPRTILVVGRPGIGKSLLTKRIFHQWQQQEAHIFWHDKIVILLRFRTFNKEKTSLRGMLRKSDGLRNVSPTDFYYIYEYICLNPWDVVLIFDGLDELKIDDECLTEENTVNGHEEVTHILFIFKQLVKGELLRGVTVLITSRPTAEQIYSAMPFDREVEILGFHERQIKNYVENFCSNDLNKSAKIWQYIKESPELLSLCYVPVNSYIVCLTLTETFKDDSGEESDGNFEGNVPKTITELYKRAIKILLYKHHLKQKNKPIPKDYIIAKLPEHLENNLNRLKEIARNGMINDELIFEFQNMDEFVSELSDCGLFNKLEDKRRNFFCFLHLTIQEFLAAQHVVDEMKNVESFISENIKNPRWHLVIQFIAGLIGDKIKELKAEKNVSVRSFKTTSTENTRIIERICKRFQDWIPKKNRITSENNALLAIKCIYEMQDIEVLKLFASFPCDNESFTLENLNIAPVESPALFEFLSNIKSVYKLVISYCGMEHFGFRELGRLLRSGSKISYLYLKNTRITGRDAEEFFDVLRNEICTLTELNRSSNELPDMSVKYVSDALKSKNCKLTKLRISGNKFTDEGAKYLSEALKSENCKLAELNISGNKFTDEGAKYLSEALKSENCKLAELHINYNDLTDVGAKGLSDALKTENCKLAELNISYNELTDVGAKYLSDALKSENCKLTKLDISGNELTDVGAEYLRDVLKDENCKITKLNITGN